MKLVSLTPTAWDTALAERSAGHFLQSWAWGDFQEKLGNKIWRLAVEDNGEIVAQLLVIKLSLGLGQSLLYSPRGQLIDKTLALTAAQTSAELLLDEVKRIANDEKVVCFRIDPPALTSDFTTDRFYASHHFTQNPKPVQPKHSLILELGVSLDQLLNRMKPKTRYNIHLAEKHGMTITLSHQPTDIEHFLRLTHATADRQGFAPHSDRYYRTQFTTLETAAIQELWLAHYHNEVVGTILVNYFGDTATYVHGASDSRHRELMAPYLLQFAAIKNAKERGLKYYDFWGIHPDPQHPWAGFTRFKRGFGGEEVEYLGTLELPINSLLYKLYRLVSRLR